METSSSSKLASFVDEALSQNNDEPISLNNLNGYLEQRWPHWRQNFPSKYSLFDIMNKVLIKQYLGFRLFKYKGQFFVAMSDDDNNESLCAEELLTQIVKEQIGNKQSVSLSTIGGYLHNTWPNWRADLGEVQLLQALMRFLPKEQFIIYRRLKEVYISKNQTTNNNNNKKKKKKKKKINKQHLNKINNIEWNIEFINDAEQARVWMEKIYSIWEEKENHPSQTSVVAVDCEGDSIGGPAGRVTLIQVAVPEIQKVLIFDVLQAPKIINPHREDSIPQSLLRNLLEDEKVVKVMHCCPNDAIALRRDFGVRFANVFDVQVAHYVLSEFTIANAGLNELLKLYGRDGEHHESKKRFKSLIKRDFKMWTRRPLTEDMLQYAADDVRLLVPHMHLNLRSQLNGLSASEQEEFSKLCKKRSLENVALNDKSTLAYDPLDPSLTLEQTISAPLLETDLEHHNSKNREVRQFGCSSCSSRTWWKRVDIYKPVSRCRICKVRYDAIPPDQEYGYGLFECSCGHVWTNRKSRQDLAQDCKVCGNSVICSSISPPPKRYGKKHSNNRHSCEGCSTGACRFSFVPSAAHISTGSTVSTSLSVKTLAEIENIDSMEEIARALRSVRVE